MASRLDTLFNQIAYENRPRTKGDVLLLLPEIKTLQAKIGILMNNEGIESRLVYLTGTMPIHYHSVTYNIPIDIFLPLRYPLQAPKIFVRPTANMVVHANHQHVDKEGLVFTPYLSEWGSSSSLRELLLILESIFSADPPLFTESPTPMIVEKKKPLNIINNFHQNPTNSNNGHIDNGVYNNSQVLRNNANNSNNSNNMHTREISPSPMSRQNIQIGQNSAQNSTKQFEQNVTEEIQKALKTHYNEMRDNLDEEFITQNNLEKSKNGIQSQIEYFILSRSRMEIGIEDVFRRQEELGEWVAGREKVEDVDCESFLLPYDDLSVQTINLQSEQLALEETLYILEQQLRSSETEYKNIQIFLKTTRKLSRQLFLCKLHLKKINSVISNT